MKSTAICEVKYLEGDDPNGTFEAILSAPTLDRDGEVIDARAFEPLPARIPIDIDHGMTVAATVGSGVPYYEGDVLKIQGSFSSIPRAQELRTLVREGHVARMSVTFMDAARSMKDGVPHVTSAELLNAAFVPIPSNRDAAVLVAKAFAATPEEMKATKSDRLQSIHDLAVANGATCDSSKAHTPETPEPPAAKAAPDPETVQVAVGSRTIAQALSAHNAKRAEAAEKATAQPGVSHGVRALLAEAESVLIP